MTRDPRVIVGAGCTGLVCAIHLARAGLAVTVLEHAPAPGGAAVERRGDAAGIHPRPLRGV